MNIRTKLIGTIVLGAALLVPVAQAQSPDDRPGLRGPGGIAALQTAAASHPDNRAIRGVGLAPAPDSTRPIRPDDRTGARGPGAFGSAESSAASHPDNRADARGPGAFTTVVVASRTDGFDWGDALIGGLGGVGTALLLTGCLFLLISQRSRARVA
jgi:hypothetical protein